MANRFRNFEPSGYWSVDGKLTPRAQAWTRDVTDFLGAREGTIPAASLGAPGGTTAFLRADGSWAVPAYPVGANPSVLIGTSATNGSAATFMRSDAAPALDLAIAPTWAGLHTFSAGIETTTLEASGEFGCNGATPQAAAVVNAAITATAGAAYTATEQQMINDLKALTTQLRALLIANGQAV